MVLSFVVPGNEPCCLLITISDKAFCVVPSIGSGGGVA
jgi:hypothetical protein